MEDKLLTTAEVAALFRTEAATVALWAREGTLPSIRTPGGRELRFWKSVIDRRLEGGTDEQDQG